MGNKWLCNKIDEINDLKLVSHDDYYISYTKAYNNCISFNDIINEFCNKANYLINRMYALNDVIKTNDFSEELDNSTVALSSVVKFYKENFFAIMLSVSERLEASSETDEWFATTAHMYAQQINKMIDNTKINNQVVLGTAANFATGFAEGFLTVGESIIDGVVTIGALAVAPSTLIQDIIYGTDTTDEMFDKVGAFVKTDYVGNAFDYVYDNTALGDYIKQNSIGDYEKVRTVGNLAGKITATALVANSLAATSVVSSAYGLSTTSAAMGATNFVTSVGATYQNDLNTTNSTKPMHAVANACIDAGKGVLIGELASTDAGLVKSMIENSGTNSAAEIAVNAFHTTVSNVGTYGYVSTLSAGAKTMNDSFTDGGNGLSLEENFKKNIVSEYKSAGTSAVVTKNISTK